MRDTFGFSLFSRKNKKDAPETAVNADLKPGAELTREEVAPGIEVKSIVEYQLASIEGGNSPLLNKSIPVEGAAAGSPTAEELEAFFPSEEKSGAKDMSAESKVCNPEEKVSSEPNAAEQPVERRRKRRVQISAPVRVRSLHRTHDAADEVTTTINISRLGILIQTNNPRFVAEMEVSVTLPYSSAPGMVQAEQPGVVVWVRQNPDGSHCVAISLGFSKGEIVRGHGDEFLESKIVKKDSSAYSGSFDQNLPLSGKPIVLVLDADATLRDSLRGYLSAEGYDVLAVSTKEQARKNLEKVTPALVVAEIEGEGMPGYDLCSHCKATPRLQKVPVMLMTSSAYPSDYASAHSLGAMVCIAKPFKQERFGHVVRLLAPPPHVDNTAEPPRPADRTRRAPRRRREDAAETLHRRYGGRKPTKES